MDVKVFAVSAFLAILQGVIEEKEPPKKNPSASTKTPLPLGKGELPNFNAWQLAWELGYTIAIPIVVFALVGRYADKALGTSPWMLLAGIVISIIISSALVYRKVKKIL